MPETVAEAAKRARRIAHFGGFLAAGTLAFLTDIAVFQSAHDLLSVPALLARPVSISVAMVVSWLINRTVTFPMPGPPRLKEFLHFAAYAWAAAALNYAVFAAGLWLWPNIWLPAAIFVASLAAMGFAYVNMRFAVFRKR